LISIDTINNVKNKRMIIKYKKTDKSVTESKEEDTIVKVFYFILDLMQ